MIWAIIAMILTCTTFNENLMISSFLMLNTEVKNIVIMTMLTMCINELMLFKETNKSEKKISTIPTIISIMVVTGFMTVEPLKFVIIMESTIIPLSFYILNTAKGEEKSESLKFMIFMNTAGSIPFLMTLSMQNYPEMHVITKNDSMMLCMMAGMIFLIKTPVVLAHTWLTKVHVSASGNCSMILASIMIKLGTLGFYKFWEKSNTQHLLEATLSFSLIGSFMMLVVMTRYLDSKKLIAMSSVVHMALIAPMVILGKSISMIPCIMMMVGHGLISYYLFYLISLKYEKSENRTYFFVKSSESTSKVFSLPMTTFTFLNMGMPPFMNFFSETCILSTLKTMNTQVGQNILIFSLLFTVIFTIMMTGVLNFIKKEVIMNKNESLMSNLMFLLFFYWTLYVIWQI